MDLLNASGEPAKVGSAWDGIPGEIRMGGWTSSYFESHIRDKGWLPCDGSEVSKATYDRLYEAIGNSYGTPAVATNFKLPASQDAVPGGIGAVFLSQDTTYGANTAINLAHTHSAVNHAHAISSHTHTSAAHTHGDAHTHEQPTHDHTVAISQFSHDHGGDTGNSLAAGEQEDVLNDGAEIDIALAVHDHSIDSALNSGTANTNQDGNDTTSSQSVSVTDANSVGLVSGANATALTTATDGAATTTSSGPTISPIQQTFVVRFIIKT